MVWQCLFHSEYNRLKKAPVNFSLILNHRRFGLEGMVMFKRENEYDPESYEIKVPVDPRNKDGEMIKIGVFDKVMVEISVEKVSDTFVRRT